MSSFDFSPSQQQPEWNDYLVPSISEMLWWGEESLVSGHDVEPGHDSSLFPVLGDAVTPHLSSKHTVIIPTDLEVPGT